jgi:cytochrome c-type biogenesis protein CcmE
MNKNAKIFIGVVAIGICSVVIGLGIFGARILSGGNSSEPYFKTVSELTSEKDKMLNKSLRISGAVIGESIRFDEQSKTLSFLIADVPADYEQVEQQGGLAKVLENTVKDSNRQKIEVIYVGEKPDLLRNMTQAIIVGRIHEDGKFYADEILLKCPSRYEQAVPDQAVSE